jgi:hypothetical protein
LQLIQLLVRHLLVPDVGANRLLIPPHDAICPTRR